MSTTVTITMQERRYFERIHQVVEQVPRGQVSTYGDIALIVGGDCDARIVGLAMGDLGPRSAQVPWQRIINRSGGISTMEAVGQRERLRAEGVGFDDKGKVLLDRFRWAGPTPEWASQHGFTPLPARTASKDSKEDEDKSQLRLF
jgi:methylated-DNA-protein-cysteine methyltransferase related protein